MDWVQQASTNFRTSLTQDLRVFIFQSSQPGCPVCTEFFKDLIVKSTQQQTNHLPRPAGQIAFACALTVRHAAQIVRASKQVPAFEPETNGFDDRGWYPGLGDV